MPSEEDQLVTATDNMHKIRHSSVSEIYERTDRQTDKLYTILYTPVYGEVIYRA